MGSWRLLLVPLIVIYLTDASGRRKWLDNEVISQLNWDLNLTLNIYMDWDRDHLSLTKKLLHTDVPNMLLGGSNAMNLKLLGTFTERALTIVYLKESTLNQTLSEVVKVLWQLHHLPLLFILPTEEDSVLETLFERALHNGFLHVLVLHGDNLYTYQPYPTIRLTQIQSLEEYHYLTKLKNLEGLDVFITRETVSPRCFNYTDRRGQLVYAGYMYNILHTFIKFYNGTERGIFDGLNPIPYDLALEACLERRIHFASRVIPPFGWRYYIPSTTLYNLNTYVIVPHAARLPKAYYFLRPFDVVLWTIIIFSMIYNTILINWIYRHRQPGYSIAATFLEVLQFLCFLSNSHTYHYSKGWRQVLIFLTMTLFGFMLTNLYLALLLSMLTSGLYERQMNSLDDLSFTQLPLILDYLDIEIMKNRSGIHPQILSHATTVTVEKLTTERLRLNANYLHMGYKDRVDFVLYQQKFLRVPILQMIDEVTYVMPFFVPAALALPYLELFNFYLRSIWESGIFRKMYTDSFEEGILSGEISFRITKTMEVQTFDTEFYYFAYTLLASGWVLGFVVFIGEHLMERWRRWKQQRTSFGQH
ncbi:uncharacterized protein LOC115622401 [Scaptodrosophila lebanonensis]|uniref:Uncharacterized protein LOC115622401 n=1 Tax=Drosophila lebanonensis TaxID=7225 RepID=A0A6J2T5J4_DROLE|nr:uncharacterized protein LOC115622401 [Scaptodrosophila lebanonensis]